MKEYLCKSTGKVNNPDHQSDWCDTKEKAIANYKMKYPKDDINDTSILVR